MPLIQIYELKYFVQIILLSISENKTSPIMKWVSVIAQNCAMILVTTAIKRTEFVDTLREVLGSYLYSYLKWFR